MKKLLSLAVSFVIVFSLFFTSFPVKVTAADFTATINISTTSPKTIPTGMTGPHNEFGASAFRWDNPELINKINSNDQFGYVRINGTNLMAYDIKTGMYSDENIGQMQSDEKHYYGYTSSSRLIETKGGETLEDLRVFLQATGSKVIIPVNVFTNTIHQIGNIAGYCYDNHIPVLYFELGNEVSFYAAEANYDRSDMYKTGTDYLSRMEAYDREIKNSYPGAKTVVAMDNTRKASFNEDFKNYPNKFWDAVTTHRFLPDGDTVDSAIIATNGGLDGWDSYLDHYVTNSGSSRIEIGEHSTALSGTLSLTHYNGIAVAESMLRLSKNSYVDAFQSWRIPLGSGYPANDNEDLLQDAFQRSEEIDTNTLSFNFYDKAPSISTRIVDSAINNSNKVFTTTVTGGTTVATDETGGTMPALYAQGYRGVNGNDYLVIVNKSASTHDVTVKKDNTVVNQDMTMSYVTASPSAKNSSTSKPVYEQTATVAAGAPVTIPAYSVTRLEWSRSATPDAPTVPWLSHADPNNSQVDLKWLKSLNATGYKVKYTDANNIATEIDVGNVTSYSVTGLTIGAAYNFAVAAYNGGGTSAYSDSDISDKVTVKLTAPGIPTITRNHYGSSKTAVIEWKSIPYATGYKVKYGTVSGTYTNTLDVGNNLGKVVENINNGTQYYFVVSAYNALGESANSVEETVTPKGDVPLAPHDLSITSEGATSISLKWQPTKTPRQVHYFENGNTNWTNIQGTWAVVPHFDTSRDTNLYKASYYNGSAVTSFDNVATDDLEGEAKIYVNGSYGIGSQVGVIAQFVNNNNYYKFVYDADTDSFRISKRYLANFTTLAEVPRSGQNINEMVLRLEVKGNQLTARVGSTDVFGGPVTDPSNVLSGGTFGLVSVKQEAYFDEVRLSKEIGTYNVYRSTNPNLNYTLVKSGLTGTTYTDSGLDSAKTYYYRVTATNNSNESYGNSNTIMKD